MYAVTESDININSPRRLFQKILPRQVNPEEMFASNTLDLG